MANNIFNINIVIVTYNRIELLKKTIANILGQTYPINKLIIINNASTDGTDFYLSELSKKKERIIVENLEQNIGGAGGFHAGIKRAYYEGCDFIWIMDDDCICSPNALYELIKAYLLISKVPEIKLGFLSSDVRYKDGKPCLMNISNPSYIYNEFIENGIIRITHTSFVAMLLPSPIVKEFGLPFKEFFIWGDDGEYSTRILQNCSGYMVGTSIVYHYMDENKGVNIFDTPSKRIDRFYYFYRNWMFTHKIRSKKEAKKEFKNNLNLIKWIILSQTPEKWKKAKTVWKGTIDGLKFKAKIDYVE